MDVEKKCELLAAELFILENELSVQESLELLKKTDGSKIVHQTIVNTFEFANNMVIRELLLLIKEVSSNYKTMYDAGKSHKRNF